MDSDSDAAVGLCPATWISLRTIHLFLQPLGKVAVGSSQMSLSSGIALSRRGCLTHSYVTPSLEAAHIQCLFNGGGG